MSLLTELMDRPLDPSYATAAAARTARGETPRRRPWDTVVTGVVAVLCGLLFTTSGLAFARADAGRDERTILVGRIEERQRAADDAAAHNAALEARLRGAEAGAVADDEAARLDLLRAQAGATEVEGPGLRLTLDDAPGLAPAGGGGPREETGDDTGRILYRDLQNVTNELWAAGAEAVAVNGHRLTSTTAIRFAGEAILVGFRPLARPYVVDAVMGPAEQSAFTSGAGGRYLADLHTAYSARAEAHPQATLRLPPADSTRLRYAREPSPTATPAKENG